MSENPYETPQVAPEKPKKAPWWMRIVSAVLLTMAALLFILVGLAALGAIVEPETIGPQTTDVAGFILGELCCSSIAFALLATGIWISLRGRNRTPPDIVD